MENCLIYLEGTHKAQKALEGLARANSAKAFLEAMRPLGGEFVTLKATPEGKEGHKSGDATAGSRQWLDEMYGEGAACGQRHSNSTSLPMATSALLSTPPPPKTSFQSCFEMISLV